MAFSPDQLFKLLQIYADGSLSLAEAARHYGDGRSPGFILDRTYHLREEGLVTELDRNGKSRRFELTNTGRAILAEGRGALLALLDRQEVLELPLERETPPTALQPWPPMPDLPTRRDMAAYSALQGILARASAPELNPEPLASWAYSIADAMERAR